MAIAEKYKPMVLVPEVIDALAPYKKPVILAAGGIVTGRQMAATMAMGPTVYGLARFG
ncbi:MAG: hypothetical protein CM1200mP24_05110 [Gammaproteobacteria bacterium]|nr:MAG: hypothetical protein CM1200mP24_05110 [Gammaproteobacteria bacterium]